MEKSLNFRKLSNFRFFWWFVLVNVGVVATLAAVTQGAALPMTALVVVIGSAGSVFGLLLSRWLAVKAHSIVRIDDRENHEYEWLVDDVREISGKAGLKAVPQVGVWPGPDANAFATGPGPKKALVAFSTPLLEMMTRDEVKAIAAHEIAHIANREGVPPELIIFSVDCRATQWHDIIGGGHFGVIGLRQQRPSRVEAVAL